MEQLVANILYSAAMIFLVGFGFSIIFSTARFFHFAHAAIITAGAYIAFACLERLSLPFLLSILIGLVGAAALGWCLERGLYRNMRHNSATPLVLLLASLGIYIVIQNVISLAFGDDTKVIASPNISPSVCILGAYFTYVQILAVTIAVATFLSKVYVLDKTRIGLALRAVSCSPELSNISGIDLGKTMGFAFFLGSFLAGVSGILQAYDVGMMPTMGLPMLLPGVVAVIVGGNGKTAGLLIASVILATVQELAGWRFGARWEETIALLLLLAFLMYRPQGIMGKLSKIATS